jgi:hypothetical protein
MHMWHHVTNHLIISTDKDSNSENRIKLRVRDISVRRERPTDWGPARVTPLAGLLDYLHIGPTV